MINLNLTETISKLEDRLKAISEETKTTQYKKLDLDLKDQFTFLDVNAQSFASGLIDLDISQYLYNKLRDYENTSLADRIIISELMMSLLKTRLSKQ